MKEKLLLIAYRALGDHIYWSPLIPILTEKYDVYLETNTKGWMLFHDDMRFKGIARYTDFEGQDRTKYNEMFKERWAKIREQVKPDREINLNGTLELACIGENFQDSFYWPIGFRRAYYGANGFYDATFKRAGLTIPNPFTTVGMYFTDDQTANCERWRERHKDQFIVVIPVAGSTAQKVFHNYREVAEAILERYSDAVVYLAGDESCRPCMFEHPRVFSMIGSDVSIKQAVHRMKYADMVIGPETFLLVAAGMFGTPKIFLATTSSVWQMTQYQRNDFSIQAPVHCSPCHRAIYYEDDCETPVLLDGKFSTTTCSKKFRTEDIMQRVEYVYHAWKQRSNSLCGEMSPPPSTEYPQTSLGSGGELQNKVG